MPSDIEFDKSIATLKAQVAYLTSNLRMAERRIATLEEAVLKTLIVHPVEPTPDGQSLEIEAERTDQPSLVLTNADEILLVKAFRQLKEEQQENVQSCSTTVTGTDTIKKPSEVLSSPDESRSKQDSPIIYQDSAHEASSSSSEHKASNIRPSPSQDLSRKPKLVFGQPSTPYRREGSLNPNLDGSPFGNYVDKESPFSRLARQSSRTSLAESWHQERKSSAPGFQPAFGAPSRRGQDFSAKAF